jgi:hypothetical protein
MNPLTPSPELAVQIRRRIDALQPAAGGEWSLEESVLRACKEELGALPLHANTIYLWALQPDGTLQCMDHEAFARPTVPETDPQRIFTAVVHGARRYPELQELVPRARVPFLMRQGREYRASDVSREQLAEAIHDRRVLLAWGTPRGLGSGDDMRYAIAQTEDLDSIQQGHAEGIIRGEAITEEYLADQKRGSAWDSEWEFWDTHDRWEIERPCRAMTAGQRVRLKQAVASFTASLLERMPFKIVARSAAYRELLRLYARSPSPELARRVVACARETGFGRVAFDPDQSWETEGRLEPVADDFRKELPPAFREGLRADCWEEHGPMGHAHAGNAEEEWLRGAVRRWITDTAWEIQAGEEASVTSLTEEALPAFWPDNRVPSRPVREERLQALLEPMNALQTQWFRGYCLGVLLAPRLRALPAVPARLRELLDIAIQWSGSPRPEITAQAGALADEAIRIGGSLYGAPFRLMTVRDPREVASRMVAAARETAVARFRGWTQGLEMRGEAEGEVGELAADAMRETLRRHLQNLSQILPEDEPFDDEVDLLAQGLQGWQYEPEYWELENGVLHGVISGIREPRYLYTERVYPDFQLTLQVKLIGGNSGICFRGMPSGFAACSGYEVDVGEGGWGCLREEGGRGELSRYDQTHIDLLIHRNDWNLYRIRADGPHLEVWLNGVKTVDLVDEQGTSTGAIAFQLYARDGQKTEAWFKNIHLGTIE